MHVMYALLRVSCMLCCPCALSRGLRVCQNVTAKHTDEYRIQKKKNTAKTRTHSTQVRKHKIPISLPKTRKQHHCKTKQNTTQKKQNIPQNQSRPQQNITCRNKTQNITPALRKFQNIQLQYHVTPTTFHRNPPQTTTQKDTTCQSNTASKVECKCHLNM